MECKYLNRFSFPESEWAVESCTANDRPYVPSISEQSNYCKSDRFVKCPLLTRKEHMNKNLIFSTKLVEEPFNCSL